MATLNYLRVARGAAQLLLSPHFRKVRRVIEQDIVEDFSACQQSALVAAQAGCIFDFGPRVSAIGAREVLHDHRKRFVFLAELRGNSRWNMAFDAGDVFVGGSLPRLVVGLHDVAATTELRLRRDLH